MSMQHVVITGQVEGNERRGFDTYYYWDGRRFPTADAAIRHGFTMDRGDDFNLGRVDGDRLVWFGWMDDQHPDEDRQGVAAQIGLKL